MEDRDVSQLGIQAIEYMCEDLAPTSVEDQKYHADIPCTPSSSGPRKIMRSFRYPKKDYSYPTAYLSACRRSSRNKLRDRFHDEK